MLSRRWWYQRLQLLDGYLPGRFCVLIAHHRSCIVIYAAPCRSSFGTRPMFTNEHAYCSDGEGEETYAENNGRDDQAQFGSGQRVGDVLRQDGHVLHGALHAARLEAHGAVLVTAH